MYKGAIWIALQLEEKIPKSHCDFHPPDIAGIYQSIKLTRTGHRKTHQLLHIVITTDDAVERDNISGRDLLGQVNKIAMSIVHAPDISMAFSLFPGYGQIGCGCVDISGILYTCA